MRIYTIILWVVGLLALCVALYVFRRKISKRQRVIYILLYLALAYVIYLFPLENLFMSFDSPEEAFAYSCRGEIVSILEGEQSYMVSYQVTEEKSELLVAKKYGSKYKLEDAFARKIIKLAALEEGQLMVLQVRGTEDYYISLIGALKTPLPPVTDSAESVYHIQQEEYYGGYSIFSAEAFVENLDENFCITIGEHTYKLFNEQ